jgi:uncharacterized protein YjbI with pentapeptide repeats
MCFEDTPTPMEAETWTLKETITWLSGLELSKVIIELDCLLVMNVILSRAKFLTCLLFLENIYNCSLHKSNLQKKKHNCLYEQEKYLPITDWSDGIIFGLKSMFLVKALDSILSSANLSELI